MIGSNRRHRIEAPGDHSAPRRARDRHRQTPALKLFSNRLCVDVSENCARCLTYDFRFGIKLCPIFQKEGKGMDEKQSDELARRRESAQ
jgi:hypothetical protein